MDAADVTSLLQAVSALAIAGGLLYSAAQFAAWRKAQHVANFTKLVELQLSLRKMRVDDPALAAVIDSSDVSGHSAEEVRSYYYNLMQLGVFEIAWFSHKNGQLPKDYFQSWTRSMSSIAAEPSFRKMWGAEATKIMHDDFRRFMDDLMQVSGSAGVRPPP